MGVCQKKQSLFLILCFAVLCSVQPYGAPAQSPRTTTIATVKENFQVGSVFGDRDRYKLTLQQPGHLKLRVIWRGTAKELALILNGPGQVGSYARKDGTSPLDIEFEVTSDLLQRGSEWTVSIVNFGRVGSAVGTLTMEYPVESRKLEELRPNDLRRLRIPGIVLGRPPSGETQRTILEDGTVEIRYPDGTIKRFDDRGVTVVRPDGQIQRFIYNQVQFDTPPSLPGDPQIVAWLEQHNEGLLNLIRVLVGGNETAVDNFLNYEKERDRTLYEKIYLRVTCIERLTTVP